MNDKLSLVFNECLPYDHKFSLKSPIGNYTEDSEGILIREHKYRSDIPGQEGNSYKLEFQIGEKYIFEAHGRTYDNGKFISVLGAFEDLQECFMGYSVFHTGPFTPFVIENGFLTGSFIATQTVDDGPVIEFELDIQVPIID